MVIPIDLKNLRRTSKHKALRWSIVTAIGATIAVAAFHKNIENYIANIYYKLNPISVVEILPEAVNNLRAGYDIDGDGIIETIGAEKKGINQKINEYEQKIKILETEKSKAQKTIPSQDYQELKTKYESLLSKYQELSKKPSIAPSTPKSLVELAREEGYELVTPEQLRAYQMGKERPIQPKETSTATTLSQKDLADLIKGQQTGKPVDLSGYVKKSEYDKLNSTYAQLESKYNKLISESDEAVQRSLELTRDFKEQLEQLRLQMASLSEGPKKTELQGKVKDLEGKIEKELEKGFGAKVFTPEEKAGLTGEKGYGAKIFDPKEENPELQKGFGAKVLDPAYNLNQERFGAKVFNPVEKGFGAKVFSPNK